MINCFILIRKQYILCELRRENLHTGEMAEAESGSSFNGSFLKRRRWGEGGGGGTSYSYFHICRGVRLALCPYQFSNQIMQGMAISDLYEFYGHKTFLCVIKYIPATGHFSKPKPNYKPKIKMYSLF